LSIISLGSSYSSIPKI